MMSVTVVLQNSSCLKRLFFDKELDRLEVEFVHQRVYSYQADVSLVTEFLLAESKGKFYNRVLKQQVSCVR